MGTKRRRESRVQRVGGDLDVKVELAKRSPSISSRSMLDPLARDHLLTLF